MITEKDILFFNLLFNKTISICRRTDTLEHISYRTRGTIPPGKHRPMKGFIEPIGLLMAWLTAYNGDKKAKMNGTAIKRFFFANIMEARYKNPEKQLLALKKDILLYIGNKRDHVAYKLNDHVDELSTVRTVLKNFLRSIKEEGFENMLFLGRDAWWFAVVAERLGYNYVYDSTMSRLVSRHPCGVSRFRRCLNYSTSYKISENVFVDTGFEGSIIRNLTRQHPDYAETPIRLLSASRKVISKEFAQPFISFAYARNYALSLEYYPKINQTGRIVNDEIQQAVVSDATEIAMWYAMSVWFYFAETPNFVERDFTRPIFINTSNLYKPS